MPTGTIEFNITKNHLQIKKNAYICNFNYGSIIYITYYGLNKYTENQ